MDTVFIPHRAKPQCRCMGGTQERINNRAVASRGKIVRACLSGLPDRAAQQVLCGIESASATEILLRCSVRQARKHTLTISPPPRRATSRLLIVSCAPRVNQVLGCTEDVDGVLVILARATSQLDNDAAPWAFHLRYWPMQEDARSTASLRALSPGAPSKGAFANFMMQVR